MGKIKFNFNYQKATQALNKFALKEGGEINKMKALKLIYFADRYHLRKYGRLITNDYYVAMENGPVASQTRDVADTTCYIGEIEKEYADTYVESKGRYYLKSKTAPDNDVFSDSDIEAIEFAWEKFGKYDKYQLRDLTHDYPEWDEHKEALRLKPRSRVPMDLNKFFDDPQTDVDKCFALSDEDREIRREYLQDMIQIESIWR